jgi:hypothetical protein
MADDSNLLFQGETEMGGFLRGIIFVDVFYTLFAAALIAV